MHSPIHSSDGPVDWILVLAGLLFACGIPVTLLQQAGLVIDVAGMLPLVESNPRLALACGFFVITGLAVFSVGIRGFFGLYTSLDERRSAVFRTSILFIGAIILGYGGYWLVGEVGGVFRSISVSPSWELIPRSPGGMVRWAIACLGAMLGFHLATLRPPPDTAKTFWFALFGAGAAWFIANTLLGLLVIAGAVLFAIRVIGPAIRPFLTDLFARNRSYTAAARPRDQQKMIADLRRQIQWTANSGAPPQFCNEEIARLKTQLRDLGGNP